MDTLETHINPDDERFQHNAAHNRALAAELRARLRRERRIAAASTYDDLATAERVVVPLKAMCSKRCASPVCPGASSAPPTRTRT